MAMQLEEDELEQQQLQQQRRQPPPQQARPPQQRASSAPAPARASSRSSGGDGGGGTAGATANGADVMMHPTENRPYTQVRLVCRMVIAIAPPLLSLSCIAAAIHFSTPCRRVGTAVRPWTRAADTRLAWGG